MIHKEVAGRIAQALQVDNIVAVAHCATRLRVVLKDVDLIDQEALDNDPDLKGTFNTDGQYQIIVGPGDVNKVFEELVKATGVRQATTDDLKGIAAQSQKTNPLMKLVKVLSDIFVPLIPAMVAGGLLMAINNLLTQPKLFGPQSLVEMYPNIDGLAQMINMMAAAPFAFLPILIGFTATRRFGGNEILGAAAGMMLVMPQLVNGYGVAESISNGTMTYWHVFGMDVAQAGYQGQVLPVIGVAFILANLEKFFHKHLKGAIDFTFTPMLSLILTGFITFIFVGPALRLVADGFTDGLTWLVATAGFVGYGIFGLVYSPIVITGLHQSFPAIETQLLADIAKTGGDFIFPIAATANMAQAGATFGVYWLSKGNSKMRALASSAGTSALLGITEPAMFGVNLKYKYPFFIALGAAGFGSVIMGLYHVLSLSLGPAGFIGFVAIPVDKWTVFFVGILSAFAIACIGTVMYGGSKRTVSPVVVSETKTVENVNVDEVASNIDAADITVNAPVSGELRDIATVADPVFSSGMMGPGVAIEPQDGLNEVVSPVTGEVVVVYETGHAYGIKADNGVELLIHVGVDTVNMQGEGFEPKISVGQQLAIGDVLGTFDVDVIKNSGYDATTMVLVTNADKFSQVATNNEFGAVLSLEKMIFKISK